MLKKLLSNFPRALGTEVMLALYHKYFKNATGVFQKDGENCKQFIDL
jgi:hypothetical protein